MLRLRADFAAETGYEMPEVDLGGGYAIAYTPESEALDVEKASLEIADVVAAGVDGGRRRVGRASASNPAARLPGPRA